MINSLVNQNEEKHIQANSIIETYCDQGYIISSLNLQEILFVLGKLKMNPVEIEQASEELFQLNQIYYFIDEIKRATTLAKMIGFKHINDCIHTAIAEAHCTELITYNKKEFSKISKFTTLKIQIL